MTTEKEKIGLDLIESGRGETDKNLKERRADAQKEKESQPKGSDKGDGL